MEHAIKTGDEVVMLTAIIKIEDYDKVKIPHGSFAKAWEIGRIEELLDQETCKGWGGMVGIMLARLAVKLCPDAAKIFKPVTNAEQPV
jgi:hypothetical protein